MASIQSVIDSANQTYTDAHNTWQSSVFQTPEGDYINKEDGYTPSPFSPPAYDAASTGVSRISQGDLSQWLPGFGGPTQAGLQNFLSQRFPGGLQGMQQSGDYLWAQPKNPGEAGNDFVSRTLAPQNPNLWNVPAPDKGLAEGILSGGMPGLALLAPAVLGPGGLAGFGGGASAGSGLIDGLWSGADAAGGSGMWDSIANLFGGGGGGGSSLWDTAANFFGGGGGGEAFPELLGPGTGSGLVASDFGGGGGSLFGDLWSGGGGNLGQWGKGLSSLYSAYSGLQDSKKLRDQMKMFGSQVDPWGTSGGRAGAAAQLAALNADPKAAMASDPRYAAMVQAAQRATAPSGQGSGAMAVAGAQAGGNWYGQRLAELGGLAGIGNAGIGGELNLQGTVASNRMSGDALASLGYGINSLTGGGATSSMPPQVRAWMQQQGIRV